MCRPLVRVGNRNISIKTCVVGTQKNCLFEKVLFEYPKHMLKIMGKKILSILHKIFCLSKPMHMWISNGFVNVNPLYYSV